MKHPRILSASIAALAMLASASAADWTAATGTQSWGLTANWTGGIPDATDAYANFGAKDFTAGTIALLSGADNAGPYTIGQLDYQDNAGTAQTLILRSGTLELDTAAGTPAIFNISSVGATSVAAGLLNIGNGGGVTITNNNSGEGVIFNIAGGTGAAASGSSVRLSGVTWTNFTGPITIVSQTSGAFVSQEATNQINNTSELILGSASDNTKFGVYASNTGSRHTTVAGLSSASTSSVISTNGLGSDFTINTGASLAYTYSGSFTTAGTLQGFDIFKGGTGTQTLAGSISGNGGTVTVNTNGGTLVLNGGNGYAGQTVVNSGGTLQIGNASALGGSFSVSLTTDGTTTATPASVAGLVVGQEVSGTNIAPGTRITAVGASTITLSSAATGSGANATSFAGSTVVNATGTLNLNGQTTTEYLQSGGTGAIFTNTSGTQAVVNSTQTLVSSNATITGTGNILWNAQISGNGGGRTITKTGANTLTLAGTTDNSVAGNILFDVQAGTLVLAKNATGNVRAADAVTIGNSATVKFDPAQGTVSGGNLWGGQINGTFTLNAGGTLDLNGSSGQNSRFQQLLSTDAGGTVTNTSATAATLGISARDTNQTRTFAGTIQDGAGTVGLDFSTQGTTGSGRINLLTGANTYSGGTTIGFGTVRLGSDTALGAGKVTLAGSTSATLDLNARTMANALANTFTGTNVTNSAATTATINGNMNETVISDFNITGAAGSDIDWNGNITRTSFVGTINKTGLNAVKFGGSISGMSLNATAGALVLSGSLNGNAATIGGSATMQVTATGNMNGANAVVTGGFALNDNADFTFNIAASGSNNAITGAGAVTIDGDFVFNLAGAGTTEGNSWQIVSNGTLTETFSSSFTVVGFTDIGGDVWQTSANGATYEFSEGTGTLAVVPEPSSMALLLGGIGMLGLRRSRRRAE